MILLFGKKLKKWLGKLIFQNLTHKDVKSHLLFVPGFKPRQLG
jgi:hypothetical protein